MCPLLLSLHPWLVLGLFLPGNGGTVGGGSEQAVQGPHALLYCLEAEMGPHQSDRAGPGFSPGHLPLLSPLQAVSMGSSPLSLPVPVPHVHSWSSSGSHSPPSHSWCVGMMMVSGMPGLPQPVGTCGMEGGYPRETQGSAAAPGTCSVCRGGGGGSQSLLSLNKDWGFSLHSNGSNENGGCHSLYKALTELLAFQPSLSNRLLLPVAFHGPGGGIQRARTRGFNIPEQTGPGIQD